jgi:hypothetical protein
MPALGLSATIRKASEFGLRGLSLALTTPRMVSPQARYPSRPHDGILFLQKGDNASTDYYLRPRLPANLPVEIIDLDSPREPKLLRECEAMLVIVCRYICAGWLADLYDTPQLISRVAFFADDDLPGMMADRSLPFAVRGKVARHYGRYADWLSRFSSEVWFSTPALAARYPQARATVLAPVPEADYAPPPPNVPPIIAYHSTDVHAAERLFVIEVARLLSDRAPEIVFEMTGDAATRRQCADLANVRVLTQAPWPAYRDGAGRAPAALSLAPLLPSAVNEARAPVKAFDAGRMGAAGLFAARYPHLGDAVHHTHYWRLDPAAIQLTDNSREGDQSAESLGQTWQSQTISF